MAMKDEIKDCVIANLECALDPYMAAQGFSRGKTSLFYKRRYKDALQKIEVTLQIHPKDDPDAAAAIYPLMEIRIPEVDEILDDMVGDNLGLLEGVTGGFSRQPIEFTASKAESARWFVYQSDSVLDIVKSMRIFIERWTIPFLDSYATPEDIIATDERSDTRLPRDRAQMMRVVAAALVCDRKEYASDLMEKRLGAIGARRRYQQVFDYIQNACPFRKPFYGGFL